METDNIQKSMEQDERIERFIRNQMSQEEEKAFLDDVRNDAELKGRAFATALMAKGMKAKRKEEEQAFLASLDAAMAANTHKPKTLNFRRFASVAASLLIVLGLGGYLGLTEYGYRQRSALVSVNISLGIMGGDRGGGSSSVQDRLDSIATVIKDGRDMTEAIAMLHDMYSKRQTDVDCAQYSATIGWYLAMAYIKDNQKDKAVSLLVALKKEQPEMGTKIDKMLRQLQLVHHYESTPIGR